MWLSQQMITHTFPDNLPKLSKLIFVINTKTYDFTNLKFSVSIVKVSLVQQEELGSMLRFMNTCLISLLDVSHKMNW